MATYDESKDRPPTYDQAVGGEPEEASFEAQPNIDLYPLPTYTAVPESNIVTATLLPHPNFNVKEDVIKIRKALEDEDEDLLIQVLCHRSKSQRDEIAELYLIIYNKPLPRDIKNYIGSGIMSWLPVLLSGLVMPLHEFLARAIHNSPNRYRWMCYILIVASNETREKCQWYYKSSKYIFVYFTFNIKSNYC